MASQRKTIIFKSQERRKPVSTSKPLQVTTLTFQGSEFPENLRCPICLEIPEKEIYQCRNGHTICSGCYANVPACPQCRVNLVVEGAPIRNRALESLLETLLIPCPYKQKGCKETVLRKDLSSHKTACNFNGKCVRFCENLGFRSCSFLTNAMNVEGAVKHFVDRHAFHYATNGDQCNINFQSFLRNTNAFIETHGIKQGDKPPQLEKDGMWTPIILRLDTGKHVVLLALFNGKDNTISFMYFQLDDGTNANAAMKSIQFRIDSKIPNAPPLGWAMEAVPVLQSEEFLKWPPYRIPIDLLKRNYLQADSLQLHCTFTGSSSELVQNSSPQRSVTLNEVRGRRGSGMTIDKLFFGIYGF